MTWDHECAKGIRGTTACQSYQPLLHATSISNRLVRERLANPSPEEDSLRLVALPCPRSPARCSRTTVTAPFFRSGVKQHVSGLNQASGLNWIVDQVRGGGVKADGNGLPGSEQRPVRQDGRRGDQAKARAAEDGNLLTAGC